ncbi:serine hydrolase domain-containing protein [Simiduia curdlanivorans]|uniref:Serine hydrolase domain-containing protein n=1 Tax=Simiduia curdlanivorans TaxID=1492769 RepID=A0ABV8V0B4_9GAMM|nr:serine hydrolase domain-containing protein [Simiduia curdlanivorans]MDN3640291.1 serine hydrolase domain-containing protein [Simiduia curdlanivorans]
MKSITKTLTTLTVMIFLTACNSNGSNETIKIQPKPTLKETLDTAINTNIAESEPGMAIMILKDNNVIYQYSRGLANKSSNILINSSTGFRLASISKTFTALAIMQLYEQGSINLNDKITDYISFLPQEWNEITIHHLLSHQSGILDYANDFNYDQISTNEITNTNILAFLSDHKELEFEPGTKAEYSNSGYVILAEILEVVTAKSLNEYLKENIFDPQSFSNTYILDEGIMIKNSDAQNHGTTDLIFNHKYSATGGAGQVSSLEDMRLLSQALLNDQIVTQETKALMIKNHNENLPGDLNYGYGFVLNLEGPAYAHSGSHDGFKTYFLINPETKVTAIILGNGGDTLPDYFYLLELAGPFMN